MFYVQIVMKILTRFEVLYANKSSFIGPNLFLLSSLYRCVTVDDVVWTKEKIEEDTMTIENKRFPAWNSFRV